MKKKLSERFFDRLRKEFFILIPDDAYIYLTHAGRHLKSAGTYTSVIRSRSDPYFEIGLFENIKELLRCPNLSAKKQYDYNLPRCIEVSCDCKGGKCLGLYHKKYKEDTF